MIYLLDTDTIIFILQGVKSTADRQRRSRARKILAKLRSERQLKHTIGVSAITISELEYGCRNSGQYHQELRYLARVLRYLTRLPFDETSCPNHYGQVKYALKLQGRIIGVMDLLIAAHALSFSATLVTNNTAHFNRVPGLKTVNWN